MQNSSLENGFGTRSGTWMSLKVFLAMAMINSLDTATGCSIFVTSDGKFIGKGRAFQDIEDQFTLW